MFTLYGIHSLGVMVSYIINSYIMSCANKEWVVGRRNGVMGVGGGFRRVK